MGFGSGVVVPGTGISLQNRGAGFTLDAGPSEPGRAPASARSTRSSRRSRRAQGQPLMSFGVMGGDMQPQGHVQMMVRLVDYRQNPQAAADAPRWKVLRGRSVIVEHHMPDATVSELARLGHEYAARSAGVRSSAARS